MEKSFADFGSITPFQTHLNRPEKCLLPKWLMMDTFACFQSRHVLELVVIVITN